MQTKEGRSARYTYNSTQPGGWWKGKAEKTRVNNANAGTRLIKKGNDLGESTSALSPEQCVEFACSKGLSVNGGKAWRINNHPDKGGDSATWALMNDCITDGNLCK
jgi:hypothetical protein